MDHLRFDLLARVLAGSHSRRSAIAALLSLGMLGQPSAALGKPGKGRKKRNGKNKSKGQHKSKDQQAAQPADSDERARAAASCCGTKSCPPPGRNSNRAACNVSGASLAGIDAQGSNLQRVNGQDTMFSSAGQPANWSRVNFAGACLQGARFNAADLRATNFGAACLVDADITGARTDASTNFHSALFCRTTMPDGSRNDSGCGNGSACCRTCDDAHPCGSEEICCVRGCVRGICCEDQDCQPSGNDCRGNQCFCGKHSPCTGQTPDCCGKPGACTDINSDRDNCGRCGEKCKARECNSVSCNQGQCTYAIADETIGSACNSGAGFCVRNADGSGTCRNNAGAQTCIGVDPCAEARSCGAGCICYTTIEGAGFCITGKPNCQICPPDPTCFNRCAAASERPPCAHSADCGLDAVCVPLDGGGSGGGKGCCQIFTGTCPGLPGGGDFNQFPGFCVPLSAACNAG